MPIDTRREVSQIWRQYSRYQEDIGETLVWFKFDVDESAYDDIYDEGSRTYQRGLLVPILWVDQIEDPEQYSAQGRRPTQRQRFAVSARTLSERGIGVLEAHGNRFHDVEPAPPDDQWGRPSSPWLDDRLNDICYYDGRFYSIADFQIRGRAKGLDTIIGVAGIEHDPYDEHIFDLFPWNQG